ncbi:MarR family winged helix-turn-helix transcriptional regulator [Comamonas terrigena]|uniref:MarR family winged helix-turn-helix transcriptional regulator n=1 Tax=Comamonas terrigena TaxID=32013 RepID=UPI00244815E3|nr:MarR family winged helix-turn-helix transcriptional regulator [Comamonas terrigena]MDH1703013.1 MarR family winged helix-turn-helix transcriptional regulator [Comamonas terrigena]
MPTPPSAFPPAATPAPSSAPTATPSAPRARCTSFMARSLSRKISQFYDDMLAPSGLRGTQFNLLGQARRAKDGPLTVSRLAELLNTDRTTLTRNLQTLQAQGLIEVVAGADARSRCVRVTEAGEQAHRLGAQYWRQAQQQVRALCGEDTIAQLEQVVDHMLGQLQAAAPAAGTPAAGTPVAADAVQEAP